MLYLTKKCASYYSHKTPEILLRLYDKYFFYHGYCKYPDSLGLCDTSILQALASCRAGLDRVANFCICVEAESYELRVERGALQKLYLKVQNSTNTQH